MVKTEETVLDGQKGSRVSGVHCHIRLATQQAAAVTEGTSAATFDSSAGHPAPQRMLPLLEDSSTNGTWINFTKLQKHVPRPLHSGDLVKLVNPAPTAQDPEAKCPGNTEIQERATAVGVMEERGTGDGVRGCCMPVVRSFAAVYLVH